MATMEDLMHAVVSCGQVRGFVDTIVVPDLGHSCRSSHRVVVAVVHGCSRAATETAGEGDRKSSVVDLFFVSRYVKKTLTRHPWSFSDP